MRVLVLHRIPFQEIHYDRVIDHQQHDVIYVGKQQALADIPAGLRCTRIERLGQGPAWEEVLAATQGLGAFDRVVSLSEFELLDAARVREARNVPGARVEVVELVRDKVRMKQAIRAAGLRAPRFVPCTALIDDPASAPPWTAKTVLKPRMGMCSKDIAMFATAGEAADAVRRRQTGIASFQPEDFEIEEYVSGPVIHVDGGLMRGEPFGMVANRYVNDCLVFTQLGLPLGSVELTRSPELERWAADCARAVGIHSGVIHLEGILTPDGPVFLEIAGRVGAGCIVDVVELVHGIQLNEAMLGLEVFGELDISAAKHHQRSAACYGWFMFASHHLGGGALRIDGVDRFVTDSHVLRYVRLPDGTPLPDHVSYAPEDIPLMGVACGTSTADVEGFLQAMVKDVQVRRVDLG